MTSRCGARARFTVLLGLLALAGRAAAQTGDSLCDARQSTADTCVIAADQTLPDGSVLTFTKPNVRVRSNLTFGHCAPDPATACASDADCAPPARCLRTAETIQVAGLLSVDAGAKIAARGKAAAGDAIGPDGGAITLSARDVSLAGTVGVSAEGTTGVPAGHAGRIGIDADGTVTLAASAFLDGSTSSGGCGGTIGIGNGAKTPATLTADGQLSVDGATLGGTIELVARDQLTLIGTLRASNTSSDRSLRPACGEGAGGGTIRLGAASVDFDGSVRARGNEAAGGVVRLQGVRAVTVDWPGTAPAINVTGGDENAFTTGGSVFLSASAGDVVVRRGAIEADGVSTGFGSDAGVFSLAATGTRQCLDGGTPCGSGSECAPGDACVESGGQVVVQGPLFALGGAGRGSGCVACELRGTGAVTVSAAIDVSGGKQGGVGGKVSLTGGGDLTVGPGPITADAADGGDILLTAGSRVGAARDVGGALRIVNGTQVRAGALQDDGFGGDVRLDGCDVTLEPSTALIVDGGSAGHAGQLSVVAHERLAVESLATISALPDGASALTYRVDESIAPDAILQPAFTLLTDPTLTPCPACGNGQIEPLEDCDGRGTCPGSGEVCVPAGSPGECSCAATCGTVAGIQPGEDCDGTDLGGATCVSLGFGGGTLSCGADCAFDTSQCGPERCGDGLVGPDEQCDLGTATCIGGSNGGAPCCAEADCPGGDCPGDGCTANRNDIAGCCRCDCTLSPSSSTSTTSPTVTTTTSTSSSTSSTGATSTTSPTVTTTTSTSSSTSSTGATSSTSTTVPPECTPGTPGACDDGDRCTVDSCAGADGCRHDPLGYDAIAASLAPSLELQACSGQRIPPAIGRLMKQARKLVERAAHARRPKRAEDLVRRALGKLSTAVRTVQRAGRRRLSPDCAGALAAIVGDARAETACLLRPALASPALTAPTGRE